MKFIDSRTVAVAASSVLVLLIGSLLVQNVRHGWPFSLHHGIAVAPAPAHSIARANAADAPAHPRTEVALEPAQIDAIGIRIEQAREETISSVIRAVATVVPDESRVTHVHTRVPGWIEKLYIGTTGEVVQTGQPLAGIFSQELLSSQAEFLAARRTAATAPPSVILESARARLQVLGMTEEEIRAIEASGEPRRLVTVSASFTGIVLHRGISVGTAVDPSTEIMTIADLSQVWVIAEIPEADIQFIKIETAATLDFPATGAAPFSAPVEFIYPTLSERTRTLRARFAVANPRQALRPGLYGTASFRLVPRTAITVPRDAVVDTGASQHVFVAASEHRFVPRPVTLGTRLDDRVEIRDGLAVGEFVVASGVFLIDSESRLRASGGGTGHAGHAAPATKAAPASHEGHGP